MSEWPAAVLTHIATGAAIETRQLLWVRPKLHGGGDAAVGLWTGATDRQITVEGEVRTYLGAQGRIEIEPIEARVGQDIPTLGVHVAVSEEAWDLVRGYNVRFAPVQIHTAVFDADMRLVGLVRQFEGLIDEAPAPRPGQGDAWILTFRLTSAAVAGTLAAAGKKNDVGQRARDPSDAFRKDADLGSAYSDPWGGP